MSTRDRWLAGIALSAALCSAAAWAYRFVVEFSRWADWPFYVLIPVLTWSLFAGALGLLRSQRRAIRTLAIVLLFPATLLWGVAVLIGIQGLRIH